MDGLGSFLTKFMSGIAGFIGSTRFYPTKHSIIKCKLKMKRRGPDNFGIKEFRENKTLDKIS